MTDDLSDDVASAASPAREVCHTSQAAPHTTHFTPPSPLPVTAANSQRPPAAHPQIDMRTCSLRAADVVSVLVVNIGHSLALNPARTLPRMPRCMPCPTLIPSLTTSTFSAQVTRNRGRASSSASGPRVRAFRRVFLGVQGLCGSHRCARVCSCDRVRVCSNA